MDALNTPIFLDWTGQPTVAAGWFQGSDGKVYAVPRGPDMQRGQDGKMYAVPGTGVQGPIQAQQTLGQYVKRNAPQQSAGPANDDEYFARLGQTESPQTRANRAAMKADQQRWAEEEKAPPAAPTAAKPAPAKAVKPAPPPKAEPPQRATVGMGDAQRAYNMPPPPPPLSYGGRPVFGPMAGQEAGYKPGTVMGVPYSMEGLSSYGVPQALWYAAPWNPNGALDAFAKGLSAAGSNASRSIFDQ